MPREYRHIKQYEEEVGMNEKEQDDMDNNSSYSNNDRGGRCRCCFSDSFPEKRKSLL